MHLLGTALAHVIIGPAAANREVSKRGVVLNDVIDRNDEGAAGHREAHRALTLHHQIISRQVANSFLLILILLWLLLLIDPNPAVLLLVSKEGRLGELVELAVRNHLTAPVAAIVVPVVLI